MRNLFWLAILTSVSLSCASAYSQRIPFHEFPSQGGTGEGRFGECVAGVPDVDGDGWGDVLIGAPWTAFPDGPIQAGCAYLYSGRTGRLLYTFRASTEVFQGYFGNSLCGIPDLDGDGKGDLAIVGILGVQVISGGTGTTLYTYPHPGHENAETVAGLDDLDGDGKGDMILGSTNLTGEPIPSVGAAFVISGASGTLIRKLSSPNTVFNGRFGNSVAGVPDVDGDFIMDIIIGEGLQDKSYVFSGSTGQLLCQLTSPSPTRYFGNVVAGISDLNADGRGDVVVKQEGRFSVFSGDSGALVYSVIFSGDESAYRSPGSLAILDDLNGDGVSEIAVGAEKEGLNPTGRIHIFSGANGVFLNSLRSPHNSFGYIGSSVAGVASVGLVMGERSGTSGRRLDPGRVYLFRHSQLLPSLPLDISVEIQPSLPTTLDDLRTETSYAGSVPFETDYLFRWFRNGNLLADGMEVDGDFLEVTGPTLSHHYTTKNDRIFCEAWITAGRFSQESRSSEVTVQNTRPTAPVVRILPEDPTPDDGLAVLILDESQDDDEDDIVYFFEWYESKDGIAWRRRSELSGNPAALNFGQPQIVNLYTQVAEFWRLDVTPVETDSLPFPNLQGGILRKTDQALEIVLGGTGTNTVLVLPDLNADGIVNRDDLFTLHGLWHKSKGQLAIPTRNRLFEPGDPSSARIDATLLFQFATYGWGQLSEESP